MADKKKRYGNTQKVDYLWIHETTRAMRAAFCQHYQLLEALTIIQAFECEKKNDNKMRARSSDRKDQLQLSQPKYLAINSKH